MLEVDSSLVAAYSSLESDSDGSPCVSFYPPIPAEETWQIKELQQKGGDMCSVSNSEMEQFSQNLYLTYVAFLLAQM